MRRPVTSRAASLQTNVVVGARRASRGDDVMQSATVTERLPLLAIGDGSNADNEKDAGPIFCDGALDLVV
jgi:hypothetical protein